MATQRDTWTDPTGYEWKLPPITTVLSPWKTHKHKVIAEFVRNRAGDKCQKCGSTHDLNIDHIIPRRVGGSHHPDNLQLLCRSCHGYKTGREMLDWPTSKYPTVKESKRIRAEKIWAGVS